MFMARQYPMSFKLNECPDSDSLGCVSRSHFSSSLFRPEIHEFGRTNPFVEALSAAQGAINGGRSIAGMDPYRTRPCPLCGYFTYGKAAGLRKPCPGWMESVERHSLTYQIQAAAARRHKRDDAMGLPGEGFPQHRSLR